MNFTENFIKFWDFTRKLTGHSGKFTDFYRRDLVSLATGHLHVKFKNEIKQTIKKNDAKLCSTDETVTS